MSVYFFTQNHERRIYNDMKKIMNRLLAGVLSLAAVFTTLPASQVQAAEKQYWTDAQEKAGYV